MTITDSEHQYRLQIEMAAIGCVSGTLAEWPHLLSALRLYKRKCNKLTDAIEAKHLLFGSQRQNVQDNIARGTQANGWRLYQERKRQEKHIRDIKNER